MTTPNPDPRPAAPGGDAPPAPDSGYSPGHDPGHDPGKGPARPTPWRDLRVAAGFLTVLPLAPRDGTGQGDSLARAMVWFPSVGAAIGATGGAVLMAAAAAGLEAGLAVVLAVATPVALTGALHEDGLADVADGFGGGWSREEKLRILRDSRIGAYGVVALILVFAGRFAAVDALAVDPITAVTALTVAAAASRGALPAMIRSTPRARADGLAAWAGRPSTGQAAAAAAFATGLALVLLPPGPALAAIAAAGLAAAAIAAIARRQIGGYTGDVLGAGQIGAEVAVLVVLAGLS